MGKILRAVTNDGTAKYPSSPHPTWSSVRETSTICIPSARRRSAARSAARRSSAKCSKEDNAALTLRIQGGGPIGTILAVSDNAGNVRGYVSHPEVDLPIRERDGKLDVSGAVGREGASHGQPRHRPARAVLRFLRARERRDRRGPRGVSHRERPARLGVRAPACS